MSATPWLSDEEIAEMTFPLTQPAARRKFIEREFHVKVKQKPNGQPLVGRAEMEAALLSKQRRAAAGVQPTPAGNVIEAQDWNGLRSKIKSRAHS